jgi:hypothetical protein
VKLNNVEHWRILVWEKVILSFSGIDLAFIKGTLLMEFFNDKLATKHFLLLLGHFDTTMVYFPKKSQALIFRMQLKEDYVFFNFTLVKIYLHFTKERALLEVPCLHAKSN